MIKPIKDFPGYFVSGAGGVFSTKKRKSSGRGKNFKSWYEIGGPLKKLRGYITCGYNYVKLSRNNKATGKRVHRLVLGAFVGPCPNGMEACHNNNNPRDNRLENLRWDTKKANQQDRFKNNTDCGGERSSTAKLNDSQVQRIRLMAETDPRLSQVKVAKMFNVSPQTISSILSKNTWKAHLA